MEKTYEQTKGFYILAKPSGPICNLDCHYCFYTEKEAFFSEKSRFRMSDETLEEFIQQYIKSQDVNEIPFVWQGGEPTLMGLDFYKKVIELQKKYGSGKRITNSLQTNGTLLNEEWCQFLAKHKFLVGLSLDGPEYIHNEYRVDRGGKPTFHKVQKALRLLKKYTVNFNVLVCVTKYSSKYPLEIYHFFKEEGVEFIQFIPIVERMPDMEAKKIGLRHATPPSVNQEETQQAVSTWTVEAEKYGDFLITIFEEWVRKDVGKILVMNFEQALTSWLGLPSTTCIFAETCGRAAMVEHNGDVYSCDHFMYPEYQLGNIFDNTFVEMIESNKQRAFGENKKSSLPNYCKTCEVRFACNGECPKHRFLQTLDGEQGLNYLCAGYKKYFNHIHRYMKVMVQLIENGLPASEIMEVIKRPLIIKG
ncbi:anaerobic sulfatase maturase [Neobacillus sp. C211]|uniref:anaerobic sulfatase maturase n=1 Tax=unclassified Neobacillus TaxID=2675272 RepID=UPI00397CE630